jgi:hypothetical protein
VGSIQAEFTFVVADERGGVVIPFGDEPVLWSARPFGSDRRERRCVVTRTIPLTLLKAGKEVAREGAVGAEKDRADFDALRGWATRSEGLTGRDEQQPRSQRGAALVTVVPTRRCLTDTKQSR